MMQQTFIIYFIFLLKYTGSIPSRFPFDTDSDVINVEQAVTYLNNIKGRTWTVSIPKNRTASMYLPILHLIFFFIGGI